MGLCVVLSYRLSKFIRGMIIGTFTSASRDPAFAAQRRRAVPLPNHSRGAQERYQAQRRGKRPGRDHQDLERTEVACFGQRYRVRPRKRPNASRARSPQHAGTASPGGWIDLDHAGRADRDPDRRSHTVSGFGPTVTSKWGGRIAKCPAATNQVGRFTDATMRASSR